MTWLIGAASGHRVALVNDYLAIDKIAHAPLGKQTASRRTRTNAKAKRSGLSQSQRCHAMPSQPNQRNGIAPNWPPAGGRETLCGASSSEVQEIIRTRTPLCIYCTSTQLAASANAPCKRSGPRSDASAATGTRGAQVSAPELGARSSVSDSSAESTAEIEHEARRGTADACARVFD